MLTNLIIIHTRRSFILDVRLIVLILWSLIRFSCCYSNFSTKVSKKNSKGKVWKLKSFHWIILRGLNFWKMILSDNTDHSFYFFDLSYTSFLFHGRITTITHHDPKRINIILIKLEYVWFAIVWDQQNLIPYHTAVKTTIHPTMNVHGKLICKACDIKSKKRIKHEICLEKETFNEFQFFPWIPK